MAHKKKLPGAKRGIRLSKSYGNGISVRYLPANQAWVVLWHDQVLRGPTDYREATDYAKAFTTPSAPTTRTHSRHECEESSVCPQHRTED